MTLEVNGHYYLWNALRLIRASIFLNFPGACPRPTESLDLKVIATAEFTTESCNLSVYQTFARLHIELCRTYVGRSKAIAGQYILYYPATRAISRYCTRKKQHLARCPGMLILWPILWSVDCCIRNFQCKACTFTCGIEFYVLTITQNVTIFIITDIRTGGHFRWVSQYFLMNSILYIISIACNF